MRNANVWMVACLSSVLGVACAGETSGDYAAGEGLQLDETTGIFSIDEPAIEDLARGVCLDTDAELSAGLLAVGGGSSACGDGHVLKWNDAAGAWACAPDETFSGEYGDLSGAPDLGVYATTASLAPVATSGSYTDLADTPDLGVYATSASLADVATSGSYADLAGAPDLGVYATTASLAPVATTGQYASLFGAPDLGVYATTASLASVATSGSYADLAGRPDLGVYATTASLADVATSGSYADLADTPDLGVYATTASLADVATSGSYADLSGTPNLGVYATTASLAPVATGGDYSDLTGTPDLGVYATTASLAPVATSGSYADLSGTPNLGVYATTASLAPVATTGQYGDLAGRPDLSIYAQQGDLGWLDQGSYIYAVIAGDVAVGIDQQDINIGGSANHFTTQIYQTFTAGVTGELTAVAIHFVTPKSGVTLSIRAGAWPSSWVLYSTVVDFPAGWGEIPVSAPVVAGQMYTIQLNAPLGYFFVSLGNYYAGGCGGTTFECYWQYIFYTVVDSSHPVAVTPDGRVGVGTVDPQAPLDIKGKTIRIRQPQTPAASSPCNVGELSWDASYVYVCVATDTWRRAALASY